MLACRRGFDLFYGVGVGWHVGVFVEMCVLGPVLLCYGSNVCVCVSVQRFSLGSEGSLGVFVKREVGGVRL